MSVTETARAKINLTLHVTGQRGDGYHLLDSLVVFADVADRVSAVASQGLSLAVKGPEGAGLAAEPDNLVLRAARAMGVTDVALVLEKHLPVASGIGGGSADAAATLRALARLTGRALPPADQVLRLGADVPVCLAGRPARMTGIGEGLAPLPPLPALWVVLVNPRVAVPTPQVFGALTRPGAADLTDRPQAHLCLPDLPRSALVSAAAFATWLAQNTRNDLVLPARSLAPILTGVQEALSATPGCLLVRMSGSGATHFGLYADARSAEAAARSLAAANPGWWITSGTILDA